MWGHGCFPKVGYEASKVCSQQKEKRGTFASVRCLPLWASHCFFVLFLVLLSIAGVIVRAGFVWTLGPIRNLYVCVCVFVCELCGDFDLGLSLTAETAAGFMFF